MKNILSNIIILFLFLFFYIALLFVFILNTSHIDGIVFTYNLQFLDIIYLIFNASQKAFPLASIITLFIFLGSPFNKVETTFARLGVFLMFFFINFSGFLGMKITQDYLVKNYKMQKSNHDQLTEKTFHYRDGVFFLFNKKEGDNLENLIFVNPNSVHNDFSEFFYDDNINLENNQSQENENYIYVDKLNTYLDFNHNTYYSSNNFLSSSFLLNLIYSVKFLIKLNLPSLFIVLFSFSGFIFYFSMIIFSSTWKIINFTSTLIVIQVSFLVFKIFAYDFRETVFLLSNSTTLSNLIPAILLSLSLLVMATFYKILDIILLEIRREK